MRVGPPCSPIDAKLPGGVTSTDIPEPLPLGVVGVALEHAPLANTPYAAAIVALRFIVRRPARQESPCTGRRRHRCVLVSFPIRGEPHRKSPPLAVSSSFHAPGSPCAQDKQNSTQVEPPLPDPHGHKAKPAHRDQIAGLNQTRR